VLNVVASSDNLLGEELTLSPQVDLISSERTSTSAQRR
jgi:hypothetical protein